MAQSNTPDMSTTDLSAGCSAANVSGEFALQTRQPLAERLSQPEPLTSTLVTPKDRARFTDGVSAVREASSGLVAAGDGDDQPGCVHEHPCGKLDQFPERSFDPAPRSGPVRYDCQRPCRCADPLPGVSALRTEAMSPARLEGYLRDALSRHALDVHYQPQYDLAEGEVCGVEALSRWVHTNGEIITPSVFIPMAERVGLIQELGTWVLNNACETVASWEASASRLPNLAVNVSVLQIDVEFSRTIRAALERSGLPPEQLELEITESALITNAEQTIKCLEEWTELGVHIALDDFGTGYSSLSYLARLPVKRLKLDRSLVHMMTRDRRSACIMHSIVRLGAELGIEVCAEGVETEKQLEMLMALGCPCVQGYLLARPMPAVQARVALNMTLEERRSLLLGHTAASNDR